MGLGGEVDDAVDVLFLEELQDAVEIADVEADETVVRAVLDVLQVREVAGVGQFVEVDDPVLRVFVHEEPHDVRADETGAAGDDNGSLHGIRFLDFARNDKIIRSK